MERSQPKVKAWVDGTPSSTLPTCVVTWLQANPLVLAGSESPPGVMIWGGRVV